MTSLILTRHLKANTILLPSVRQRVVLELFHFGEAMQTAQSKSRLLFWCFALAFVLWLLFMGYLAFLRG